MSNPSPEFYPPFGLYQGLRYDTEVQLRAVQTIAHASIIEYFAKQGLDHTLVTPRDALGFTLTSQRDVAMVATELQADGFDLQGFKEFIDTFPIPEVPVYFADQATQRYNRPMSLGILLEQLSVGILKRQASAAQLAAFEVRGFALPVRSNYSHVSLFRYGASGIRPSLKLHQREKMRSIVSKARAEVAIREVNLGRLLVGSQIGSPLPDNFWPHEQ